MIFFTYASDADDQKLLTGYVGAAGVSVYRTSGRKRCVIMPNRIVREGILTSETVASLSWAAEVFYRRLMSVVDDYGRFHALPKIMRAACYPLQIDKVSDADIGKWTAECVEAALVSVYLASDGKRYIQIEKFRQQVRLKQSKFPDPNDDHENTFQEFQERLFEKREHLPTEGEPSNTSPPMTEGDPPNPPNVRRSAANLSAKNLCESMPGLTSQTATDYLAYRRAKKSPLTMSAWQAICKEIAFSGVPPDTALSEAMAAGWTGFKASWLANRNKNGSGGTNHGKQGNISTGRPRTLSAVDQVRSACAAWAEREERGARDAGKIIDIPPKNAASLDPHD